MKERELEKRQVEILNRLSVLIDQVDSIENKLNPHSSTHNFRQRYLQAILKYNQEKPIPLKEVNKLKSNESLPKITENNNGQQIKRLDMSFLKKLESTIESNHPQMVKNKLAEKMINRPVKKSPLSEGKLLNILPVKSPNKLKPELINNLEKSLTPQRPLDSIKCFICKQYIQIERVNDHKCMMDQSFNEFDRKSLFLSNSEVEQQVNVDLEEWEKEIQKIIKCQSYIRSYISTKKFQKILKMSKKRVQVSSEILHTEEDYCSNLCALLNVYHKDLMKRVNTKAQILSEQEINILFGNIEQISQVNMSFLAELQKQDHKNPNAKYGSIFMKMGAFFKMYSMYIQNYNSALKTLQIVKTNPKFSEWAMNAKQSSLVKQRSIDDFLIMPIQRVPRYNLLISELLRSTWEGHDDYSDLKASLIKISEIAGFLNERKREFDYKSILLTLQNIVNTDTVEYEVIKPGRNFSSEGVFKTLDGECLRVFLFSDSLLVLFNAKGYDNIEKMKYKFHHDLNIDFTVKAQKKSVKGLFPLILSFDINKSFVLYCQSKEEQEEWLQKFVSVHKEYKSTIEMRNSYHNVFHPNTQSPFKQKQKKEKKLFIIEVWENERWFGGWSAGNLLPEIDRSNFSDEHGNTAKKEIWLEIGFIWNSNWELVINETCDKNGWKYGFNWSSHFFSYQKNRSLVRKRLWRRTMYLSNRKSKKVSDLGDKRDVELDMLLAYGDVVSIATNKNNTKLHLHSHTYPYTTGSKQQQITCYNGEDENNLWKITRCTNKEINILDSNTNNDHVFPDSYVCLEHITTNKFLSSCVSHASPSKTLQEVCCSDKQENDEKQEWKICVDPNLKHSGPLVVGQPFLLMHPLTKKYLVCEGKDFVVRYVGGIFPSHQKEVGCKKLGNEEVGQSWCVNKIYEKNLLDQEFLFVED